MVIVVDGSDIINGYCCRWFGYYKCYCCRWFGYYKWLLLQMVLILKMVLDVDGSDIINGYCCRWF